MENTNEPRKPTEAQTNANRENAKKSTGPRTDEGKAASSRNRLLHGLRANKHILLDEDPAEFLLLIHDHLDRFQPVGPGEEKLVLRIAADQWRLDRALPAEAGIYRDRFHDVAEKDEVRQHQYDNKRRDAEKYGDPVPLPPTPPDEGDLLARAFNVDCEGPNSFAKLARYEGGIERSIDRCLRQLKTYQDARNASTPNPGHQPSPPPDEPTNPDVEQSVPPAPSAATPAATPSNDANYHSNPKNGGIAHAGVPSGSAALLFLMHALLCAVPQLIAIIGSLLTGPRAASLQGSVSSPDWAHTPEQGSPRRRVAVSPRPTSTPFVDVGERSSPTQTPRAPARLSKHRAIVYKAGQRTSRGSK